MNEENMCVFGNLLGNDKELEPEDVICFSGRGRSGRRRYTRLVNFGGSVFLSFLFFAAAFFLSQSFYGEAAFVVVVQHS